MKTLDTLKETMNLLKGENRIFVIEEEAIKILPKQILFLEQFVENVS